MSAVTAGRSHADWTAFAQQVRFPDALVVDGERVPPADGASWAHVTPRDGSVLAATPAATEGDVDRAVDAARRAFDDGPWPRMLPRERKDILLRLVDLIEENRAELALMISLEMGKPISDAYAVELRAVLATYRWYAEYADKALDETSPVGPDDLALITREPIGVVGVVTPWNFPLTLSAWKIAPALAAGCTVVHKPADLTPFSALRIAELALEAGVPPGVLNVVTGRGEIVGRHLGLSPDVDALAFTGSTLVGRAFQRYAAESNLKRTWLELGGKSPNIVLPDAPDLDAALDVAAWGIFFNAGQMCTAPSRLIVHRAVADEAIAGIIDRAGRYRPGDPLDPATTMGPLASAARLSDVRRHVANAHEDGATLLVGGPDLGGCFHPPTVFGDVDPTSRLARDEVFGPVLAVLVADDEEQAIALANDSIYGLAAGLWTADLSRAHRLSRRLRAGTVWVNCYEEGDLTVPFGGFKQSGNGRDKSQHAVDKYTELKTTYIKFRP
ncbi:aldehyde dehydrogenase [Pseudonocardia sp. CA-107938]|uniref:aldehyde dehydrogenase n=1 Tax=Pseudonocardia sp. CA-107938 TaxID=3240021 RepID=UPI003D94AEE2